MINVQCSSRSSSSRRSIALHVHYPTYQVKHKAKRRLGEVNINLQLLLLLQSSTTRRHIPHVVQLFVLWVQSPTRWHIAFSGTCLSICDELPDDSVPYRPSAFHDWGYVGSFIYACWTANSCSWSCSSNDGHISYDIAAYACFEASRSQTNSGRLACGEDESLHGSTWTGHRYPQQRCTKVVSFRTSRNSCK